MSLCDAHALAPDAAPPPPTHKTSQQVAVVPPGCQASAPRSFTRYPGHFARASRFSERAPIPANHHHQHGNPAAVAGRDSPPLQFHILLSSPPSHSALLVCQLFLLCSSLSLSLALFLGALETLRAMDAGSHVRPRKGMFVSPPAQTASPCVLAREFWSYKCTTLECDLS